MPPPRKLLILAGLALLGLAALFPVVDNDFINYDDNLYVTENNHVQNGITREGVRWAFRTFSAGNWHPLTWLSHMADVELYGLNPRGHHGTSLLIHIMNTALLFLVLEGMTGAPGPSASVAALFAVHPLHVESVAWVAERKDLLSTFFWLLTMFAYLAHARRPCARRYLFVALFFSLGLLSKPMLVTLPFVLLLLDRWPLNRCPGRSGIAEKIPLLALAGISAAVTVVAQSGGGALTSLARLPLSTRLENAAFASIAYLFKTVWPRHLSVFYPHPEGLLPGWVAAGSGLLLLGLTFLVIRLRRVHPFFAVGWFWYLGTLMPVIGLVQIGVQAMADRYTYVPLLGIFIMAAWGLPALVPRRQNRTAALASMTLAVLAAFSITTWFRTRDWRNSLILFQSAVRENPKNTVAWNYLGAAYVSLKESDEAIAAYRRTLLLNTDDIMALNNLGSIFIRRREYEQARPLLEQAMRLEPDNARVRYNAGLVLSGLGRRGEAIARFAEALRLQPDFAPARIALEKERLP